MKKLSGVLLFLSALHFGAISQEIPEADTTIYSVVEEMPRFPGCEGKDTTLEAKTKCAQASLLAFFYDNISYPLEARQNGNEGMVVITFVVEKNGSISHPTVLKDIGGGCGEEAVRVAKGMNEALKNAGFEWTPGKKDGQVVRVQYNLPLRFKLKEPPEFLMIGRDTVYTVFDDSIKFQGGSAALEAYLKSHLKYPKGYADSCSIGYMDIKVLVNPDGFVKVLDLSDYCDLGFDFQFEAIQAATSTSGKWNPASLRGRKVPASSDLTVEFLPSNEACGQAVSNYQKAKELAAEGTRLYNEGQIEEGIAKMTSAIELFPNNANFLYIRGQAYMNMKNMEAACEDFKKVKEFVSISLVNELLPIICK